MAVPLLEKIFFAEHLSLMLKSGTPISEALETLKDEVKSKSFKKALEMVLAEVVSGRSLSQSLRMHPKIFDDFFCGVVEIGEKTGKLDANLKYLSLKLSQEQELRSRLRGAMIYPAILIFTSLIILSIVIFYLLPKIIPLFTLIGAKLPLPTRILISLLPFLKKNLWKIILIILLLLLIYKVLRSIKKTRLFLDRIFLSFPLLGNFLKNLNLAQFSRSLYILLKSGLTLRESLELSKRAIQNSDYLEKIDFLISEIERGERVGQSLKKFPKNFPLFFSQMILTGERTGNLNETLLYLAQFYEEKVALDSKRFSSIIEPALIVFVGILVGFIAFSVLTPIYQFLGQFRFR
jgi:type IV pilus assembly protein PilC